MTFKEFIHKFRTSTSKDKVNYIIGNLLQWLYDKYVPLPTKLVNKYLSRKRNSTCEDFCDKCGCTVPNMFWVKDCQCRTE